MNVLTLPKETYGDLLIPTLDSANVHGKKILLRADLDVPLENGKISNDARLNASLPTIEHLLGQNCQIIICGHLGRPEGKDSKLSLFPVYLWFKKRFLVKDQKDELINIGDFEGWQIGPKIQLLENLRFERGEKENDLEFSKNLASLSEVYINDAFAVSHRNNASIVGVAKHLLHFPGLRFEREVSELYSVLEIDESVKRFKTKIEKRPLTIIIGGAKIETKLPLVEKMYNLADYVLVGGEIAENTKELAEVAYQKISKESKVKSILLVADLTKDKKDITEMSTQNFIQVINTSKTIVWNGPMGLYEECFDLGTREIANAVANSSAYTIVGGGNTVEFLQKEGIENKFSFVSTGGGAMLQFLSGEKLPGIEALK